MKGEQTPYHRRVAQRLQRSRDRQLNNVRNKYTQVDRFMVIFEKAWQEYYQTPCNLRYARGWYYLCGRRYQHCQLEKLLALLLARIQEIESPNPDKEQEVCQDTMEVSVCKH